MSDAIQRLVHESIQDRAFGSASWAYGTSDAAVFGSSDCSIETLFDIASLTKVSFTTAWAYHAVINGLVDLDRPVADYLTEWRTKSATVRQLLNHTSGLAPYDHALAELGASPEETLRALLNHPLVCEPGGTVAYSCIGFITLAELLRRVYRFETIGEGLTKVVAPWLDVPERFAFRIAGAPDDPTIPPTYWKDGKPVSGVVHDPLSRRLGGASGNAGIFASVQVLAQIAQYWLRLERESVTAQKWVMRCEGAGTRGLGWDTKSVIGYTSAGSHFGSRSFGHTGYTGTCLWIDPDAGYFGVLLTNAVFTDPELQKIREVRPRYFDLVHTTLTRVAGD